MSFYRLVARQILARHPASDLRSVRVVLPNYHSAQPLSCALGVLSGMPTLLLPQMCTLTDWAQTIALDDPIQSDTGRVAALYQALRERQWFPDADLWALSRELLSLMDELTDHLVELPATAAEFAEQLVLAYQARNGHAMQFEARVVHELWYAMSSSGDLDAAQAYRRRLGQLAQRVHEPLFILQTCDFSAAETRFFDACQARVTVTVFDLRLMAAEVADCELMVSALQQEADNLLASASRLTTPSRLKLLGAQGLEQEAQAADVQVRRWLLEGRKNIAVVVQDRLVARRLRALLERASVQIQDETGWTFSTLAVSTVLMRWLEALQGDFYYQDVLDLLQSPFLFAENHAARKAAASAFELMVRKRGVLSQLNAYLTVAEREATELVQLLARMKQAARLMSGRSATLSGWLAALYESLDILGVLHGWHQDAAGQQLLQLLALWQDELASDTTQCSFAEWRRWLHQQLDLNTYRDVSVESPVLFTHLPATRWRRFEAVLLLGCDAAHLPQAVNSGLWFNDAVRANLGLPHSGTKQAMAKDDLLSLLALNETVLATWQSSKNGDANLLSPYFEMMRALSMLAFGDDLMERELGLMLDAAQVRSAPFTPAPPSSMPSPSVPTAQLPVRITPSAYNSLMVCPYQYYARHVLHLNELDEVREELDKRDYGTWVHEVLQRFHAEVPRVDAEAPLVLERISREVFAEALSYDYLAQAWLLRWLEAIPAYLEWQMKNEASGMHYSSAEEAFEIEVLPDLMLRGRIDRIDENADGSLSVFDYKTQTAQSLKSKLKMAGEDVQLACYARVSGAAAAAFVSLDGGLVSSVTPAEDIDDLARLNFERLQTIFTDLHSGRGMPAHGAEKLCGYCEMNGLCRRGEWEEKQDTELGMRDSGLGIQDSKTSKPQMGDGLG